MGLLVGVVSGVLGVGKGSRRLGVGFLVAGAIPGFGQDEVVAVEVTAGGVAGDFILAGEAVGVKGVGEGMGMAFLESGHWGASFAGGWVGIVVWIAGGGLGTGNGVSCAGSSPDSCIVAGIVG